MRRWLTTMATLLFVLALAAGPLGCDSSSSDSKGGEDTIDEPDETGNESCVPACDGKQCGDDGCGGICGHCYTMEGSLNDDLCLADQTCTVCGCAEGQECGTDACGSPCGSCPGGFLCSDSLVCEVDLASCGETGFSGATQGAKMKPSEDGFLFVYNGTTTLNGSDYRLTLEIDNRLGLAGPTGPGEFGAQFKNLDEGGIWLTATVTEASVETFLVPSVGKINITSLAASGGSFAATLDQVVLQEATLDEGVPIKIPNGRTWCLDGASLAADIAVTPAKCGDLPVGTKLGKAIGNFELQNCNGDWVDLYETCQKGEALWLVATAGW
jgi:hypothetical protein